MQSNMKFFIKTFGCQMNIYDSMRISDIMAKNGFTACDKMEDAGIIIFNTCHIREKAAEKVFSELGKEEGKGKILVVAGCVAQALDTYIFKRAAFVNFVVGPQSYHMLPKMILDRKKGAKTEFPISSKFDYLPTRKPESCSDYITIQEGCNRFCSYCVVPFTRGPEYSRTIDEIVLEAKSLISQGVKEITLLGQNVNAYEYGLSDLIYRLAELEELHFIRYVTSYPSNITPDLIEAHGKIEKLAPFLHLPVQSGSNRILKAMNRKYTREEYIDIIKAFKQVRPDLAVSSDFIVGFPGETEEDFIETVDLVEEIGFASSFSFKYSPRPGTVASEMENQIDEKTKEERLLFLQTLLNKQSEAFNNTFLGKTIDTLVYHKTKKGAFIGKSPYMQTINIKSNCDIMNKVVKVKIISNGKSSITGEVNFD